MVRTQCSRSCIFTKYFNFSFAENSNGSFCQKDFQDALKPFDENKWCFGSHLKLQDPPGPVTGLWSFPGSGNTWLRYLIQKATGLITGSVYQERTRYPNFPGFPGGDVSNGSAIVVKSHLFEWVNFVSKWIFSQFQFMLAEKIWKCLKKAFWS